MAVPEQFLVSYGVQLASSWINMMLYMLEIVMCLRYFQRGTYRPLPHRIGVGAMVIFDTVCTSSLDANVLMTFLVFFGKGSFSALSIPTTLNIFMTYFVAVIEQLFLCHLYFIITRKRLVSLCLVFLAFLHLGFSSGAAIMVQTAPTERLTDTVTAVGAVLCAITDLQIAGCLGYELFKIRASQSSQSNLLRRVFVLSITSGAIVATTTLLMMILFLKGSVAFEFFFTCQGRVYALTLLVNFLSGTSSSCSGTSPGSDTHNNLFRVDAYPVDDSKAGAKQAVPSIYSNFSDESLNKELPPVPGIPPLQIVTQFPPSAPFSSSFPGVVSPQTPRTPRTNVISP
ncbi:hypothetical protein DFH06DRAFT_1251007 [Mycena polygramma]|nr:hypothetical protein DFH06DRAFT_1251007 [Mycena polygramma]